MKLCVDCKFFNNGSYDPNLEKSYICNNKHSVIYESMIGGNKVRKTAYTMRSDGPCFPEGRLFKAKGEADE